MTAPLFAKKEIRNDTENKLKEKTLQELSVCNIYVILFICLGLLLGLWSWALYKWNTRVYCTINVLQPVRNVSEEFLSVALDTAVIQDGLIHKLRSRTLQQRATLLGPAYLRVGGTTADCLLFERNYELVMFQNHFDDYLDGGSCSYEELLCTKKPAQFVMSRQNWVDINKFAKNSGLKLIFDLNVLLRNGTKWNSTNAKDLIEFSNEQGFNIIWQLGNEPNSFLHVFETSVSGQQLAEDFLALRNLLDSFPYYKWSQLVGPDVTRPRDLQKGSLEYLSDFLANVPHNTLNAVTWHQYYVNGRTATANDFISPKILNILQKQITAVKDVVDEIYPNTPIWLSETSSAYGGGAPGLSNRFLAGFLWLDKLGLAARMGIDVVIRQSLFRGNYALLDSTLFNPWPDWWLSVLFKTFVGRTVLSAGTGLPQGYVRLYAHCTNRRTLSSSGGSITIYGMNLKNDTIHVHLSGLQAVKSAYVLTGADGLTSKWMLLNGKKLELNPDGSLPPFIPDHLDKTAPLAMPPFSMGFWVLPGLDTPACDCEDSFSSF